MVAFNKLLNVFVFALAIATLYFAISLKEQRKVMASQRLELAKALNTISKDVGREVATNTLNTAEDEDKVVELVSTVVKQKDGLADTMVTMGQTLGIDESKLDASKLKGLDKDEVDSAMDVIKASVTEVADRDEAVNTAILSWADVLGEPLNKSDLSSLDNYKESLTVVGDAVAKSNQRHTEFVDSLQSTLNSIDEFEWSFSPAEFAITDRYQDAFNSLKKDLSKINLKLAKVNELNEIIENKDVEITGLNTTIADRDEVIKKLETELTDITNMKVKLEEQLKNYTNVAGYDPNVVGKVIGINPEFGFIVTSLNKNQTGVGQQMFVRRGSDYIGTVEVKSLTDDNSVADVLVGSKPIKVGDKIFFKSSK